MLKVTFAVSWVSDVCGAGAQNFQVDAFPKRNNNSYLSSLQMFLIVVAQLREETMGQNDGDHRVCALFIRRVMSLLIIVCAVLALPATQAQTYSGMPTWHNDTSRTGQNLQETILTPSNVNSTTFGKIFSYPVDGDIFGQPLFVYNVTIPNKGTFNVVYVVTENDSVYAFDANGVNTGPLWQDVFINPSKGITPIPCKDTGSDPHCPYETVIGISGTPVIDLSRGTMYLVYRFTKI
jgi:hypothetical protein